MAGDAAGPSSSSPRVPAQSEEVIALERLLKHSNATSKEDDVEADYSLKKVSLPLSFAVGSNKC